MKWCGSVCTFHMITIFVWVGTTFRFFVLNFHSFVCFSDLFVRSLGVHRDNLLESGDGGAGYEGGR